MKKWITVTYIVLSEKAALHRLIITKYDVQTSNSLQDIRQNPLEHEI